MPACVICFYRYGIDDDDCGAFVVSMGMNPTSLGDKCAAQYSTNADCSDKYRSFDGSCNHIRHKTWGKVHTSYIRLLEPQYSDGMDQGYHSVSCVVTSMLIHLKL
jgi:hypothetical protein